MWVYFIIQVQNTQYTTDLFFDIEKAFDLVQHMELLKMLSIQEYQMCLSTTKMSFLKKKNNIELHRTWSSRWIDPNSQLVKHLHNRYSCAPIHQNYQICRQHCNLHPRHTHKYRLTKSLLVFLDGK